MLAQPIVQIMPDAALFRFADLQQPIFQLMGLRSTHFRLLPRRLHAGANHADKHPFKNKNPQPQPFIRAIELQPIKRLHEKKPIKTRTQHRREQPRAEAAEGGGENYGGQEKQDGLIVRNQRDEQQFQEKYCNGKEQSSSIACWKCSLELRHI